MLTKKTRSTALRITNVMLAVLLCPVAAWGWGDQGHKIVAVIAADNLTPTAQIHVASILGAQPNKSATATAMEAAAILPDRPEFREEYPLTKPWHFIDICLKDRRIDVPGECHEGNCVTAKIDEYSKRLKDANYDRWGAAGDLAFLIHFVGDIHQPLHAANNGDLGGNCVIVDLRSLETNLHAVWDTTVVRDLEYEIDSGKPETTAHKLERTYAAEKELDAWVPGHTDDIAWESNQIAHSEIYEALKLPVEPCVPPAAVCGNKPKVELNSSYLDHADTIAGHQLAKAGFRLASLLNEIWTQPVAMIDTIHAASPAAAPVVSSAVTDRIVGNRRSKIYAWPGCGTYDKMAPENRVEFPSREAAEQAGYRAARNCP